MEHACTLLHQCAIDTRFGGVGSGTFDTLDRQGAIPDHRVVSERDIALAASTAPAGTRSSVRGAWVRRLDSRRSRYICGWEGIRCDDNFPDLSDPFTAAEKWQMDLPE